eukprot:SAG31_NODE_2464_length_5655_cov_2.777898_8_plen_74_part_00
MLLLLLLTVELVLGLHRRLLDGALHRHCRRSHLLWGAQVRMMMAPPSIHRVDYLHRYQLRYSMSAHLVLLETV